MRTRTQVGGERERERERTRDRQTDRHRQGSRNTTICLPLRIHVWYISGMSPNPPTCHPQGCPLTPLLATLRGVPPQLPYPWRPQISWSIATSRDSQMIYIEGCAVLCDHWCAPGLPCVFSCTRPEGIITGRALSSPLQETHRAGGGRGARRGGGTPTPLEQTMDQAT